MGWLLVFAIGLLLLAPSWYPKHFKTRFSNEEESAKGKWLFYYLPLAMSESI
jgi:hypothetical protein